MNYITCHLQGGLGNQLFQIIATYSIGWKYGLNPVFIKIHSSPSVFKNRPVYWNNMLENINLVDNLDNIKFLDIHEKLPTNYNLFLNNIENYSKKDNIKLVGYFQTSYFYNLYPHKFYQLFNLEKYNNINLNHITNDITVSIHVRHGDYLKLSKFHNVLDLDYYKNSINYIKNILIDKNLKFIVFSDDIKWCKSVFLESNFYFIESNNTNLPNEVYELILMSKCNHNILANSSFSWCSSIFNKHTDKIVIAPKKWFAIESENKNYGSNFENWISF